MAEVEEDQRARPAGASWSSSAKIACFSSTISGPFSWTKATPLTRLGKAGRDRDPGRRAVRIVGKAMARERVQFIADQAGRGLQAADMRVGEPHMPAGAGEDRRPGPADQAGADDGDGGI